MHQAARVLRTAALASLSKAQVGLCRVCARQHETNEERGHIIQCRTMITAPVPSCPPLRQAYNTHRTEQLFVVSR